MSRDEQDQLYDMMPGTELVVECDHCGRAFAGAVQLAVRPLVIEGRRRNVCGRCEAVASRKGRAVRVAGIFT